MRAQENEFKKKKGTRHVCNKTDISLKCEVVKKNPSVEENVNLWNKRM